MLKRTGCSIVLAMLWFATMAQADPCTSNMGLESACRQRSVALRIDNIQVVGTHNSYKMAIPPAELALIRQHDKTAAVELDYGHAPLAEQLDLGMRAIELDVVYDPVGGRYARPLLPALTAKRAGAVSYDASEMFMPGFKVLHIPDIDVRSRCVRFVVCLRQLKAWSDAHRDHVPILITINAKDGNAEVPGGTVPLSFDAAAFDALDSEIRSVFSDADLVTPDSVRGGAPTLRDSVRRFGWPTLAATRGKFIFALDEDPDKVRLYLRGHASLEGLPMFVNSIDETAPHAGYFTLNDPVKDFARIRAAVGSGFLVRTRADEGTHESRGNDIRRRTAAFSSGAQYVSTDYPRPREDFGPYMVALPNDPPARCNPVRPICDAALPRNDISINKTLAALQWRLFPTLTQMDPANVAADVRAMMAARRRRMAACGADTACLLDAALWREAERGLIANRVAGCTGSTAETCAEANDAIMRELNGLNEILRVYGMGKVARYPAIDGPDAAADSARFKSDVAAALAPNPVDGYDSEASPDPSIDMALNLLDAAGRLDAIAFEPIGANNRQAVARSRTLDWTRYRFTAIIVPGVGPDDVSTPLSARGKLNVRLAAQMYDDDVAPFIIVSGGAVHPRGTHFVEAVEMRRTLMERYGIPADAILIEPYARHTTTNLRNAARLLSALGAPFDRDALIVSNAEQSIYIESDDFHQRNLRELGYQPGAIGGRLSAVALTWRPSIASIRVDPTDALDP